ncbi:fibrinogen-like YCDxxxxGGGW domain-containing protein [Corynebacterium pilosum]|uniref:fibrinogen-like YCDxxxxGGGW domain-containing protein n=1 Tax=Corynebacterium pilosum TaxID=35756 RepID=UPI00128B94D6|nr:fibrinogen-like YCDxxxxGGGW domain-containing protein [Corynebacterium pilosum]
MKLHSVGLALATSIMIALGVVTVPNSGHTRAVAQEGVPTITRDGSSPERAAASCWAIKQENPRSQDGRYWLLAPDMDAPQEFFCDQTMDGGGWVMIGRGREGWDTYPQGQGDPASLTSRDRTTEDFAPVQLPEDTINGLLSRREVRSLPEASVSSVPPVPAVPHGKTSTSFLIAWGSGRGPSPPRRPAASESTTPGGAQPE